jgi:type I restriction enzyme S subunit
MKSWRDCKLGDLLQIKHGFAFLGEHFASAGTHVVLTPGNFLEEGGFKEKSDKAKWYNGPIPDDYVLNEGDLIVAMTEQAEGLLGSSALIPRSGVYLHNQRLGLVQIRDRKQTDQHFIYYLFNSRPIRQQIRASASGTKIRHTAPSRIADVKVSVPPLPVQRRIAGILSAYDELMENSQRHIRILEAMARALYREWFVHFRFPGHEKAQMVNLPSRPGEASAKTDGDIPQGWQVKRLDNVCRSVQDGDWIETKDQGGKDYRLLQISNVGVGEFIETANYRFVTQATFERLHCTEIKPGDILVARMPTPIGRAWLATPMPWRMITAVDVAIIRAQPGVLHPLFLAQAWNEPFNLQRIAAQASGTTRLRITRRELAALEFVVPQIEIQFRFAKFVQPQMEMIEALRLRIQNLRRTRDLLLPRLLSGQIELTAATTKERQT